MNRDELRKRAAELNITGRGSMSKAELEQAVSEAEKDANTIVAGVGTLAPETQHRAPGSFKALTDKWVAESFPSVEQAHRMVETFDDVMSATRYARYARHKVRMGKIEDRKRQEGTARRNTERQLIKILRISQARFYGQGGRGMGAKHYASRSNPLPVPYVRPVIVGRGLTGVYAR